MQRDQVLGMLAAVRERLKVGVEQRVHAALELVLRQLVRTHEAEPSHLRAKICFASSRMRSTSPMSRNRLNRR